MFAVVAVNAAVHPGAQAGEGSPFPGPTFHYHIPPPVATQVRPGVLIEVPFGSRQVQGLVIDLADAAPVQDTRPITRLLFEEPVLDANQIALGKWLSEYYLAPLIDCFRVMLPPGMLRQPRSVVRLHPETPIPEDLPATQQKIVDLLQHHSVLSPGQIGRRIGRERARRAIRALVQRGILIRSSDLPAPRARPKRVNFVRLLASPPQVAGVRPMLGRPAKQADVLQVLLDERDPLPSAEHVMDRSGVTASTLNTLSRKEWVELVPERTLIALLPGTNEANLQHASKQAEIVDHLRAQGIPVEENALRQATGASTRAIRALEERELIQRLSEPATVFLRLDDEQARQQIVDLRGARRQHQVLDYLLSRPLGEWVWVSWVYAETDARLDDLRALEGHGLVELAEKEMWRDPLADRAFALQEAPRLTPDQERTWEAIRPHIEHPPAPGSERPPAFLVHGVTGSGKTEIYMRAVQATLAAGRQAIVLVPEISLTPQTIRRFAARFPDGLGVLHSTLSDGERYDTWRRIRSGQIKLVIGPRSALFAPFTKIGLIVLDEEHESSYKQSDVMPTYHARDVAFQVAILHGATVILGSATPDLVTYHRARETPDIDLLELPQRLLGHRQHLKEQQDRVKLPQTRYRPLGPGYEDVFVTDLPPVRVVDMRHELRVGNRSMFSRLLQDEIKRTVASREQVILFLNRRGAFTFVLCRDCGNAIRCPRCDIPLTFHLHGERLTCHHCNHQQPVPHVCPLCQSTRIRHFGAGTQRVEAAVTDLLPSARTLRWDRDATREKGSHDAILDRFARHQADVLIGTQMIAKGLDLPLVTLVGVITADTALNLPDFRASERTFQMLAQVAGRAGRGPRGGQVIIQTYMPEHDAIQTAAKHDYAAFYRKERPFRHRLGYPPYGHLARLLYSDPDAARSRQQAQSQSQMLHREVRARNLDQVSILGPAPAFLSRLRGRWRWQIILLAPQIEHLQTLLRHAPPPSGWRLDIDPLDLL